MINRVFVNKNRTLIVEAYDINQDFVSYVILKDKRPFSEFQNGTMISTKRKEFDLDFVELVNIDILMMQEMVNKVFGEVNSRLAMLKVDILTKIHKQV